MPGKVLLTMDSWTRDNTQGLYLGMTVHWINIIRESVEKGEWELRSEVVAFWGISGNHSGQNIGRYLLALAKHVGIIDENQSKIMFLNLSKWDLLY